MFTKTKFASVLSAGAIALLLLTACGAAPSDDEDAAADPDATTGEAAGPWTFTDDRGETVELDEPPATVAAQSAFAGGLWEYGIVADGVFGPLERTDGTPDPIIGRAPPEDLHSLGEVDGQVNLEALAALDPDLIVTGMWDEDEFWGIEANQVDEVSRIAPIVGIRVDNRTVVEPLERVAELAEALGADAEVVADLRDEFEASREALESALADQPDLDVVAASGSPTEMYIAYPPAFPDLAWFQELGMQLAEPDEHPTSGGFWETLSWEEADTYPADLILADARGGSVEQVLAQVPGTVLELPAVRADQMVSWEVSHAYGYGNLADIASALAESVAAADAEVVG